MSSSKSDRSSRSWSSSEDDGTSIIPMAVSLYAQPKNQHNIEFKFPGESCRFNEHLAMAVAREFVLYLIAILGPPISMIGLCNLENES